MTQALDKLAALAGIQPEYDDIWGNTRRATAETRRALLDAMGVACGTEVETQASLRVWQESEWRRPLSPVAVVSTAAKGVSLRLNLPMRDIGRSGRWRLTLESGSVAEGEFHPGQLPVDARTALDEGEYLALTLALPACKEWGYHALDLALEGLPPASMRIIVCPTDCYQPDAVRDDHRVWGASAQLYGLRSERNWGMGDFTDLKRLMDWAAQSGAGLIGVNPLHALYPHNPRHCSPYSPSSRVYLNVLYIDVEAVPEFSECDDARTTVADAEFQAKLRALRATPLVDYGEVAAVKFALLERLWRHFREQHLPRNTPRASDFRRYVSEQGESLWHQALFEALQAQFSRRDPAVWGWPAWPEKYREPDSPAVKAWAARNSERVEYYQYLQWLAAEQLAAVGTRSYEVGLGVGLYQDLAVGVDRGGAETWMHRELYAFTASVGAPPDDFNLHGQDWGLPPLIPHRLREVAYEPFIRVLRANMREAGALRFDHVMSMMRLYWVPPGMRPDQGVYVSYPFEDLLGILALESHRNQCLVIGEDLGTVPDRVRRAMRDYGILSYRLFYFQKSEDGSFTPPAAIQSDALVAISTHDLPTLAGYWRGLDLDLRADLGLYPSEAMRTAQVVGRAEDRARLLMALEKEGLLPEGVSVHPVSAPEMTSALLLAVHRYLARSTSRIMLVQAEDMLGALEQANLPGTVDDQPNWQRKLSLNLEEWPNDARLNRIAEVMVAERGRAVTPRPRFAGRTCPVVNPPRATYRLQLNKQFTFAQANALLPYLDELGVSHLYCSPFLKARPDSLHGYDIIDHASLNPEIGSREDFERLLAALEARGMHLIVDMVPNHMGVMGADNGWWLDVLENGQVSNYADFFDIDWNANKPELRGRVLIPVLGDHFGAVLEQGELKLAFDEVAGEFSIWYWQHRFPVDPGTYPTILGSDAEALGVRLGESHPDYLEYQSLVTALTHLPAHTETDPSRRAERLRDKEIHKRHLAGLCGRSADIRQFIAEVNVRINGTPGEPASFEELFRLLCMQPYRLAHWRVAADEINYRRFFDVNDLAALRMEREEVFVATHKLIAELFAGGRLTALRIDHSDGLLEPDAYFARLHGLYHEARPAANDAPYVLLEKILAPHERLPAEWEVCGTTGYDFANLVNGLFIDAESETKMTRAWQMFSGSRESFEDMLYHAKRTIMKTSLASELNVLANRLSRIAEMDRHTRDYTLISLRGALMEIAACFPVYRTYIRPGQVSEDDRRHIEWACAVARKKANMADVSVFDFVRDVLVTVAAEGKNAAYRQAVEDFAMRFQQFSSPVMAKGMEDTAFYRYHRLVSLNEVGGDPRRYATSTAAFHHANQERLKHTPHTLLAGSTHDSKRGEDVRARINVLAEMPDAWRRAVQRWHRLNRGRLGDVDGRRTPARADEYLLYQTLIGTWPLGEGQDWRDYAGRIRDYMTKAVREAKVLSSWLNPDAEYEGRLTHFIDSILPPEGSRRFLEEFTAFAERVAFFGRINSLAQTVLRLTAPGVPDIYQGAELWNDRLVDPDNRQPVDHSTRERLLEGLRADTPDAAPCVSLLSAMENGAAKLHLVRSVLTLRREQPELFERGAYVPLEATGSLAAHVVAYARSHKESTLIAVAPRLAYTLMEGETRQPMGQAAWKDTVLPVAEGAWRNVLDGQTVSVGSGGLWLADGLAHFPVAVLAKLAKTS